MATQTSPQEQVMRIEHDSGAEEQQVGLDNVTETIVGDSDAPAGLEPTVEKNEAALDWDNDLNNPHSWTPRKKMLQILMAASTAFTAYVKQNWQCFFFHSYSYCFTGH
jgi:hypothetical protein